MVALDEAGVTCATVYEEEVLSFPTTRERNMEHLSSVKVGKISSLSHRQEIERNTEGIVIWPWTKKYKAWWILTVICANLTVFTETYAVAFAPPNDFDDTLSMLEYCLVSIFFVDIIINFHLAYYDEFDKLVTDKKTIAIHYLRRQFWLDCLGVFPIYIVALAIAGEVGNDGKTALYLSLFRLVKLVRYHRMKQLFDILQYNPHVSLLVFTLIRNFGFAILWSHFSACTFYFIARQYDFDPDATWIGGVVQDLNPGERYVTSLYFTVVTFTTVGFGDYSPVNPAEQLWGIMFMLLNMATHAWIVGSITLLIVKHDQETGAYREAIHTLKQYAKLHNFPSPLEKKLRHQLKLDFNNREISDEQVLQNFPTETRRKVLRRLYLPALIQSKLMKGVRQQFVDAFLTTCKVEIFNMGEELLQRGSVSTDLYLLVDGTVILSSVVDNSIEEAHARAASSQYGGTSISDSRRGGKAPVKMTGGEFINDISFFTESAQMETVKTRTICKTLTISRAAYRMIADDHPSSVTKVLQNLLEKVEDMKRAADILAKGDLASAPPFLLNGILQHSRTPSDSSLAVDDNHFQQTMQSVYAASTLGTVKELVQMHMNKLKDDNTTRFLFAASRGDTNTINLMCEQGFDPNSADYDQRTALMVASMKGNTDAVERLFEFEAKPNLVDMHGTSALLEAVQNGHEDTMMLLLKHGATLCLSEAQAAGRACQAVFDGDMVLLRRLLKAGLFVDAGDYDRRTALHIAAAEANISAAKVLLEFKADVSLQDRWGNTAEDEARRVRATKFLEYLESLKPQAEPVTSDIATTS